MARILLILLACSAELLLTGCADDMTMMQTKPVCTKPHGGGNMQLAPMYQCEEGFRGRSMVN